jgi:hypothetical protein
VTLPLYFRPGWPATPYGLRAVLLLLQSRRATQYKGLAWKGYFDIFVFFDFCLAMAHFLPSELGECFLTPRCATASNDLINEMNAT